MIHPTKKERKTMEATVVIGANYGDEGKGHLTDYFCDKLGKGTIVVRFNGGSQAGHTVVTPELKRHVFSHFSSGTFAGTATYLSEFFIVNPTMLHKELETLKVVPLTFVDPNCRMTTIYDIALNQVCEYLKGENSHSTCGVGINETVVRCSDPKYATYSKDMMDLATLDEKLYFIKNEYVPKRIEELGLDRNQFPDIFKTIFSNDMVIDVYFDEVKRMREILHNGGIQVLSNFKNIVFEGAQGLQLDEDNENFPYVTRSKTGLHNVVLLADQAGIDHLDVTYVTRCYLTRHGDGPLDNETNKDMYPKIEDETNKFNDYQGDLRFGILDLDLLKNTITKDLLSVTGKILLNHSLAINCLDQVGFDGNISYIMNKIKWSDTKEKFVDTILDFMSCDGFSSVGPTREDILIEE